MRAESLVMLSFEAETTIVEHFKTIRREFDGRLSRIRNLRKEVINTPRERGHLVDTAISISPEMTTLLNDPLHGL